MNYIIYLMNKSEVEITEQEYKNLVGKSGLVYIPSQDRIINTNSIVEIVNSERYRREREGRSDEGMHHDGIPVIRYFGNWYLKGEMEEKDGKLIPIRIIDPICYPEVARDCVVSTKEFKEKYEMLPKEERLKLMIGNIPDPKKLNEFKSVGELLEDIKKEKDEI